MSYIRKKKKQQQFTLAHSISARGIGIHSGQPVKITLQPAPANQGISFKRTDIPHAPMIPARFDHCQPNPLRTVIAQSAHSKNYVMTIEHLMAAFYGCGIDNAYVYVDSPEIPAFDGSARDYVFLINCAGLMEQNAPRKTFHITKDYEVGDKNAWIRFTPSRKDRLRIFMEIHFPDNVIGIQKDNLVLTPHNFQKKLADNRTFVDFDSISHLHKLGLGQGGTLANTIVIKNDHVMNPEGLRSPKEFIRHKMMDAVGDLYLSGCHLYGDFHGYCSGHALNAQLLRAIFQRKSLAR